MMDIMLLLRLRRAAAASIIVFAAMALGLLTPSTTRAGQGWYLLTPPLMKREVRCFESNEDAQSCGLRMTDIDAPITEWDHSGAFDSAKECEDRHTYMIRDAKTRREDLVASSTRKQQVDAYYYEITTLQARCITTDDPRLVAGRR
jgi:hypothetical protein